MGLLAVEPMVHEPGELSLKQKTETVLRGENTLIIIYQGSLFKTVIKRLNVHFVFHVMKFYKIILWRLPI
jgi:hypothetical protein